MSSKSESDPLDLSGFVIRDADVEAQNAQRWHSLQPDEYLQFLVALTKDREPSREIPPFHEPFRL